MRPGGMLVQKRHDDDHDQDDDHGDPRLRSMSLPVRLGDLKKAIVEKTRLEPQEQKVLFREKEKEDSEHLHVSAVKDKSKVLLLEELTNKEKKLEEVKDSKEKNPEEMKDSDEKKPEEVNDSEETRKALQVIAGVRAEIDKLSERVAALQVAVNCGTKVSGEELDKSAELLMRELLKLDGIEAEGEAKMQRKAEVRRVQRFHETLDNLKAINSNPFCDSSDAIKMTT